MTLALAMWSYAVLRQGIPMLHGHLRLAKTHVKIRKPSELFVTYLVGSDTKRRTVVLFF